MRLPDINKYSTFTAVIYIVFAVMIALSISYKASFHMDEIFTYYLSNYKWDFIKDLKDGKEYLPEKIFMVAVQPQHRFDYKTVWENQAKDVHPPFYYTLIHTICSFYPKVFSPWFAGSVNIIFSLLTLYVLRKMSRVFLPDKLHTNILSVAFVLSAGILSQNAFFRMYIMAMFWVSFLTYLYVKEINTSDKDPYFLIKVSAVTIGGALTHYYCILYSVLISITYGIWLLKNRKLKHTAYFCFAMVLSGVASYFIFPAMIKHIFFGYRGKEVLNNAFSVTDFISKIIKMYGILDNQLFGGWGNTLIVGLILFFIISYLDKWENSDEFRLDFSCILLFVPSVLYLIAVSKITVFITDRYIFPIYGVLFWGVIMGWCQMINHFNITAKSKYFLFCTVLCLTTIGSWCETTWPYLYRGSQFFLSKTYNYSDTNCVCFYVKGKTWMIRPMFLEVKNYKSITFYNDMNIKDKRLINRIASNQKQLVVSFLGIDLKKQQDYLKSFLSQKGFHHFEKLGSYAYGTSYLLKK